MNYDVLNDYLAALQRKMTENISNDNDIDTDAQYKLYSDYADAIDFPMRHLQYETKLTPTEAHDYSRTLCRLFAPTMIEKHLPYHRKSTAYRATAQLAHAMERLADGKRARKLFGFF